MERELEPLFVGKGATACDKVEAELKDAGILCRETHVNTIRFSPPLIITPEQVDWTFERIAPVLMRSS